MGTTESFLFFGALNAIVILWMLATWIATAFYTAVVARDKGYSYGLWFLGGISFSLIALIAAAGLPDASDDD